MTYARFRIALPVTAPGGSYLQPNYVRHTQRAVRRASEHSNTSKHGVRTQTRKRLDYTNGDIFEILRCTILNTTTKHRSSR